MGYTQVAKFSTRYTHVYPLQKEGLTTQVKPKTQSGQPAGFPIFHIPTITTAVYI